jgi:spore germination cell wall hydrolase CwlJ-like protein
MEKEIEQTQNRLFKFIHKLVILALISLMALVLFTSLAIADTNVYSDEDLNCMAMNIYFESRGESQLGQIAVAWVTLNRVEHDYYPDDICGVVRQANRDSQGNIILHQCQFSWFCDGSPDTPSDTESWNNSLYLAEDVINGVHEDPTHGAIMFHAHWSSPRWRHNYTETTQIGVHTFYR